MAPSKVLVADDNPDNVDLVVDILSSLGYELSTASDGQKTLDQARALKPDLILLDINMPIYDGYEVMRLLKADPETTNIAVLMLSALNTMPNRVKGLDLGADDYLTKPFNHHELVARVKARLRIKNLESDLRERIGTLYRLFNLYVPSRVAQSLVEDPTHAILGGARREITILFADLHGFTAMAEQVPSERVLEFLNFYLSLATKAVFDQEGTLDKFMGDAAMALFNAPLAQTDHVLRAATSAVEIQKSIATLQRPDGFPKLEFRMGIHMGEAVVGNIGSQELLNYTAVGDPVNVAKRLQENAEPGQILLSREAYVCIQDRVEARPLGPLAVRGRHQMVEVYELVRLCQEGSEGG